MGTQCTSGTSPSKPSRCAVACRVLNVSQSGYNEWLSALDAPRRQEDMLLLKHLKNIHAESRGTYGSPRVHAELVLGLGLPVNLKRVARLMREAAGSRARPAPTPRQHGARDPDAGRTADLVNQQFTVDAPNRLWITDVTEHRTLEGKVYCVVFAALWAGRLLTICAPSW